MEEKIDKWILVPLGANTNEVVAEALAGLCRANETMQTPEGPGYIVPSDLFIGSDGISRPSVFIKKVELSARQFNLRYSLYRIKDKGKPQKWGFSFIGRGKKCQAAAKRIGKVLKH